MGDFFHGDNMWICFVKINVPGKCIASIALLSIQQFITEYLI